MRVVDVLKVTTPALRTRSTTWINPILRRFQNLLNNSKIDFLPLVSDQDFCSFAGHGSTDKNNTTLDVGHKVTPVGYFSNLGSVVIADIQHWLRTHYRHCFHLTQAAKER